MDNLFLRQPGCPPPPSEETGPLVCPARFVKLTLEFDSGMPINIPGSAAL